LRVARRRFLLPAATVFDDGTLDILAGASGLDWFFISLGDLVTRIQNSETVG
jgi:hypothetical protein